MENKNTYKNFKEAADSNFAVVKHVFSNRPGITVKEPNSQYSPYDGVAIYVVNGVTTVVLVEVKRRQFDYETLMERFGCELFLEKSKYDSLMEHSGAMCRALPVNVNVLYLNTLSCGRMVIFDLMKIGSPVWTDIAMNARTYENRAKKDKRVAKLHVSKSVLNVVANIPE